MEGFGEIMTLEETAKFLKIGKSTLYKMIREGLPVSTYAVGTADRPATFFIRKTIYRNASVRKETKNGTIP